MMIRMKNNNVLKLNILKTLAVALVLVLLFSACTTNIAMAQSEKSDFKLVLKEVDNKNRIVYVDLVSGKGSNIAAGAFRLEYNPDHMVCSSIEENQYLSSNILLNESFDNGNIKFSYVNTNPISEEIVFLTLKFKVNDNYNGNTSVEFKHKDAVDYDSNEIALNYVDLHFKVPTKNPFFDVKTSDWFYSPVIWALEKGVTTGTSATTFEPQAKCTRGQVVTFLWRAAGKPEPVSNRNPFSDLERNAYYEKAVLWAYENGITTGTSQNNFSPEDTVTRAQFVTFLWRLEGKNSTSAGNPFIDVPRGQYYYDAVLWAYKEGITTGTSSTTFEPDSNCLRQEVVTFLYRNFN